MYNHLPIGSLRGQTGMPVGGSTWMGSFPVYGQPPVRPPIGATRSDTITNPYGSRPGDMPESFSVTPLAQAPQQRQSSGGGGGMTWDKFGGNKLDTWNGKINGGRSPKVNFGNRNLDMELPAFKEGGPPPLGTPILVGEEGPEVIQVDANGPNIIPNNKAADYLTQVGAPRNPGVVQFDAAGLDGPEGNPNYGATSYFDALRRGVGNMWDQAQQYRATLPPPPTFGDMFDKYAGPPPDLATRMLGLQGVQSLWPNFANGLAPSPQPAPYQQQPSAPLPLSGLTPYAPALAPLSQVSELFGGPSVFDNPARPMMSASPEPMQGPPAPAPVPQQNVPQGANLRNAFTMQAPAQDDRVDSFGRFVPGAQTWARNLFQSAKAFPERKDLAETAAQAAQWASMTKAQRLGALSAGERAVNRAERGNAMPVFSQNPDDAALERDLLSQLNQFNRTGNLPGASVQQLPTGGRNLVSPYGTGYSTNSAAPVVGIFRMSPSTYGTIEDVRADDAAREPNRRALWQNRQDNFRRQMLGLR